MKNRVFSNQRLWKNNRRPPECKTISRKSKRRLARPSIEADRIHSQFLNEKSRLIALRSPENQPLATNIQDLWPIIETKLRESVPLQFL